VATAALVVAVVAVCVSLLTFGWTIGWSVWQHRKTTSPQVTVDGSFAVLGTEPTQTVYGITAVNDGVVPVTLTGAFAEVEGASNWFVIWRFIMQSPENLSTVLGPGEHWKGFMAADEFRQGVAEIGSELRPPWRVRVGVTGAGRKHFRSEWFTLSEREFQT
jgi:hypothetical protein